MKEILAVNSAEPSTFTRAQFKDYVAREFRDWSGFVLAADLKVE
jgi:hypothetical protein